MPNTRNKTPRVLIVTPEITYLPAGMGEGADRMRAKAGGLADVSSSLIRALYEQGGDVHVTLPNYRAIFRDQLENDFDEEVDRIRNSITSDRIHLAEDRAFFYLNQVYSGYGGEDIKISLAFQREVINHVIPKVKPDLIHCNDWMTGLIPAMARRVGIPCLFTLHNIHSRETVMATIEDRGIDTADFWENLYFTQPPESYESSRDTNLVDYLVSGVFASHYVNTVSPTFFQEIVNGRHGVVTPHLRRELANKWHAGCAAGILNAPDETYNPETDPALVWNYTAESHKAGKRSNKIHLQERLGLRCDHNAPLFSGHLGWIPCRRGAGFWRRFSTTPCLITGMMGCRWWWWPMENSGPTLNTLSRPLTCRDGWLSVPLKSLFRGWHMRRRIIFLCHRNLSPAACLRWSVPFTAPCLWLAIPAASTTPSPTWTQTRGSATDFSSPPMMRGACVGLWMKPWHSGENPKPSSGPRSTVLWKRAAERLITQ